ncbi:uroporphyrinogen-III synthase [Sphingomonas sp. GCM10030256]|uniref:uroporphyrinogen-III synthase n=1 Tax=Sphingomonas sp. GCM10030256 TaxID=3273427 RepID=UPI00361BB647
MRRLVILRPEPGASATMDRARKRGLDAVSLPLFRIVPVEWQCPDLARIDALLVTSANAVRHAGADLPRLTRLPAYAVGAATATALLQAGFGVAASGRGGVDALLREVEPTIRLLHLCGEERHEPALDSHAVTSVVVYRAVAVEGAIPPGALSGAVALVHSPRAGQRLAELVRERATTSIAAISATAAAACGRGWGEVAIAAEPRDEALLSLAERLCNCPVPE